MTVPVRHGAGMETCHGPSSPSSPVRRGAMRGSPGPGVTASPPTPACGSYCLPETSPARLQSPRHAEHTASPPSQPLPPSPIRPGTRNATQRLTPETQQGTGSHRPGYSSQTPPSAFWARSTFDLLTSPSPPGTQARDLPVAPPRPRAPGGPSSCAFQETRTRIPEQPQDPTG